MTIHEYINDLNKEYKTGRATEHRFFEAPNIRGFISYLYMFKYIYGLYPKPYTRRF